MPWAGRGHSREGLSPFDVQTAEAKGLSPDQASNTVSILPFSVCALNGFTI